ncbi:hypothetical protein L1987_34211 [Smallanthus sonchifolius]|uniref:Uncharacterized protein n=1 Tax=Smallanthus sonchifolius TaxID=185202 RepID=A0ACB9HUP7_9ASTR|nr:hypothetical protein L1987_34211 [Smallanthus sonchifolius]
MRSCFAGVRVVEMESTECKFLVYTMHESNLMKMLILERFVSLCYHCKIVHLVFCTVVGYSGADIRNLVNEAGIMAVRVVLCAYGIMAHPDAVFSDQGENKTALAKSAKKFFQEFELLINIILHGRCEES